MINWLRRIWRNRGRGIFLYWDGRRLRRGDPLVIWRAILADADFNPDRDLPLIKSPEEALANEAVRVTAQAVRRAFGVKALEQGGMTETECVALFYQFQNWIGDVKKNTSPPPISLPPTGPESSEVSITNASSDSISTSSEPRCAVPAG